MKRSIALCKQRVLKSHPAGVRGLKLISTQELEKTLPGRTPQGCVG